eukprot:1242432-Rhodomonas_salina.5
MACTAIEYGATYGAAMPGNEIIVGSSSQQIAAYGSWKEGKGYHHDTHEPTHSYHTAPGSSIACFSTGLLARGA